MAGQWKASRRSEDTVVTTTGERESRAAAVEEVAKAAEAGRQEGATFDLTIIVVNWNTSDLLVQCLHSIFDDRTSQEALTIEVVVVDNASTDGTVAIVRDQFPQVTLVVNQENVGFAQANNQALANCRSPYVLLLNPDTEVLDGALLALVDFLEANPGAGAAGARILNPDSSLQSSSYPAPTLSRELWYLLHLDLLWPYAVYTMEAWEDDRPQTVDVLLGACLMVRRHALEESGLLDERFFMYSEEVDLCYRLGKAGWELYWVPQAEVIHYGGQSTQQVAGEMFLQLYRSKVMFFRKHYGNRHANLYKMILLLTALPRIGLNLPGRLAPLKYRDHLVTTAVNYRQLVRALPHF